MRYGVLADVHANLHALETVLAALGSAGAEAYLCTGDVVGYGPRPNECVARLEELPVLTVAGNHDLMAIGRLSFDHADALARQTIQWTSGVLNGRSRAYLEALAPEVATAEGIVLAHGALGDPTKYVVDCGMGAAQLEQLARRPRPAVGLLLGHTHHPLACAAGARLPHEGAIDLPAGRAPFLLNAGSVGQARERRPLARALILDTDARRAEFLALEYDHYATSRELSAAGLPADACHRPPRLHRKLMRALRRRFGSP